MSGTLLHWPAWPHRIASHGELLPRSALMLWCDAFACCPGNPLPMAYTKDLGAPVREAATIYDPTGCTIDFLTMTCEDTAAVEASCDCGDADTSVTGCCSFDGGATCMQSSAEGADFCNAAQANCEETCAGTFIGPPAATTEGTSTEAATTEGNTTEGNTTETPSGRRLNVKRCHSAACLRRRHLQGQSAECATYCSSNKRHELDPSQQFFFATVEADAQYEGSEFMRPVIERFCGCCFAHRPRTPLQ